MSKLKSLSAKEQKELLGKLKNRFEKNMNRHKDLKWDDVQKRLESNPEKIYVLDEMELTEGEPDVVGFDKKSGEINFYDCAPESPKGRRSYCYDRAALDARKAHKPANSAVDAANEMGIEILTEEEYRTLQELGDFDLKTSSWIKTPEDIRKKGGAIFCDKRYGRTFMYHNGADSYYAARGFRGKLIV
ncbi:DUF4256 domain-containing protein [Moheibacter sediminis]|uniref:DUF4256 domain-containing protein n=1 Tax=Moheibacter sediminis TaxID=1434700 RepID=A0A1W1ZA67_9FLAO|nr:DUF4256 domain-containing protein [Moheibacter sediminis]SMC45317.1 Protein of unknown function [Moheibacter sediminis]